MERFQLLRDSTYMICSGSHGCLPPRDVYLLSRLGTVLHCTDTLDLFVSGSHDDRYDPHAYGRGDIVITHVDASRSTHAVWTVAADGEQAVNPPPGASTALGADAAVSLARQMRRASRGAAIYLFDPDTVTWTKLSD